MSYFSYIHMIKKGALAPFLLKNIKIIYYPEHEIHSSILESVSPLNTDSVLI
jgi:hypothetical protein